jgi:hypothetical protein
MPMYKILEAEDSTIPGSGSISCRRIGRLWRQKSEDLAAFGKTHQRKQPKHGRDITTSLESQPF